MRTSHEVRCVEMKSLCTIFTLIRGCSRLSLSVQRVSRVTQRYFKTDGFVHYPVTRRCFESGKMIPRKNLLLVNHGRIHDSAKEEKVFMFVVDSLNNVPN